MNKFFAKVISVALCVAMVLTMEFTGITTAFAAEDEEVTPAANTSEYSSVSAGSLTDTDGFLTDEGLLKLKTIPYDGEKYTDIVDNGDGTYTLKQYSSPIKYEIEDGEYEYIDTTLTETSAYGSSESIYETTASDVNVTLSDNLNQDDAIQVNYGDYNIAFQPLEILTINNESSAYIGFVDESTQDIEDSMELIDECGSVVYSETFDENTDIVITPTATGVEEEIVLNKMPEATEFSYQLTVKNVVPLLRRDGNLYFVDLEKGMIVAAIPIPTMYDSTPESGVVDIQVTLKQTGDDTYQYTLYPDVDFLEKATYPVVIDPTIKSSGSSGVNDTYVKSTTSSNYCNDTNIRVGRDASANKYRGLIQINSTGLQYIQGLMAGNTVTKVEYVAYENYVGASSPAMAVHPITENWAFNTVYWSNQPDFALTYLEYILVTAVGEYRWDITSIGKDWAYYTTSNYGVATYGIVIKNINETLNMYKRFNSNDATSDQDYFAFTFVDTSAPSAPTSVTTTPVATTSYTNTTSATLAWSGITDTGWSGLSYAQYNIDGGTWTNIPTSNGVAAGSKIISISGNGTHTVAVRGVDGEGNLGTARSVTYKLDTTVPTAPTSVTTDPIATSTYTADPDATLSWSGITDSGGSGLSCAQYKVDSGSWVSIPISDGIASGTTSITISSSGTHTIYVRGLDAAGNAGYTTSVTYKLDIDQPTAPTNVALTPIDWEADTITISASGATDAHSGVATYQYSTTSDTAGFINFISGNQITLAAGDTVVYVRAVDMMGTPGPAVSTVVRPQVVTNVSVQSNVNYTIAVKWTASTTPDVTYNVYRTDEENNTVLVASGLTSTYWYDYNLNYGETYVYGVTATRTYLGATVESISSAGPLVTAVLADETDKKVGKKDYETFVAFCTQSGTGYINPASGNLYYETADISIDSPIGGLAFTRAYNSQTSYSTPLGQGWDYNYNIILLREYNSSHEETGMILKFGNGNMYRFEKNGSSYTRPAGLYASLEFDDTLGKYVLTFLDKTEYLFNLSNQIERITDRNGNWIQFTYNGDGNLISIEDNVGNVISITYSTETGEGGLIKTVTGNGKIYTYLYNTAGRLTEVYVTHNNQHIGEQYTYTDGVLTTITNPGGYDYDIAYTMGTDKKVTSVTNPLSQVLTLAYSTDNGDLLVTTEFNHVTQRYWYNSTTLVLKKMQFESEDSTELTYDSDFNLTHIEHPDGTAESFAYNANGTVDTYTNQAGKVTTYTYGDTNNPTLPTQVEEPFNGSNKKVTVFAYDTNGNVTSTYVQGINQVTSYTYDAYGNVDLQTITVTEGSNTYTSTTDYGYDTKGRLIRTTLPDSTYTLQGYDAYGNVNTETDAMGVVTKHYYNVLGQQIQQTNAFGTADAVDLYYTYDALGQALTQTDGNGNVTEYTYDALGRQARVDYADGTHETTSYTINADGTQITTHHDASGNKTVTVTDKKGQTILSGTVGEMTDSNNSASGTPYEYNNETLIQYTRNAYDVMGRVTWTTDNTGVETTSVYNNMGWVTETTTSNGSLSTTTTYTYDDAGNALTEVTPEVNTETTYDKLNRPLTVTTTKNGSSSVTQYEYNGVYSGRLQTVMTDPLSRQTTYEYDQKGNLVREVYGDKTTVYTYYDNGNMWTSTLTDSNYPSQSAVTSYTYDNLNRKTRVTYSANDEYVVYTYDDNGNILTAALYENNTLSCTTTYTYDEMNRVLSVSRDGATIVAYTYTDNGSIASVEYGSNGQTIGYEYDEAGKVICVSDITDEEYPEVIREYFYVDGRLSYLVDARGTDDAKQEFIYDSLGRLVTVKYYDIDDITVLEEYTITYNDTTTDAKSQIATETATTRYGGTVRVTTKSYTYDNLGRLTQESQSVTVNGGTPTMTTTDYTYDAVGNRLSMIEGANELYYHYNDYDQLLSTDTDNNVNTTGDIITCYTYDLSGNQITKTEGTSTTTYHYDDANWLQYVTDSSNNIIASYDYDANGQRTQKTVGTAETNYFYTGIQLLYTTDSNDAVVEQNILETDGSMICSQRADTNYYWYRQDIRGSVTNIVDVDDDVMKSYTYDAYGNTESIGTFVNSFAYTGAVIDEETGLYYMNARYYEPETGRFISQDTYRGEEETYWHLYLYSDANPVNGIDPTGHKTYYKTYSFNTWLTPRKLVVYKDGSSYKTLYKSASVPHPTTEHETTIQGNASESYTVSQTTGYSYSFNAKYISLGSSYSRTINMGQTIGSSFSFPLKGFPTGRYRAILTVKIQRFVGYQYYKPWFSYRYRAESGASYMKVDYEFVEDTLNWVIQKYDEITRTYKGI